MATPAIDARPTPLDLQLYAGDDVNLHIEVTDSAGDPVDLTGYTAEAQIRVTADAATSVDFVTVVGASSVDLTMNSAATTALPAKAVWDVQVASATGVVTTLAAGKVFVTAEVTR